MSNHTPIIETEETYQDIVARHVACALRVYSKQEHIEPQVYHAQNHQACEQIAGGWVNCKCDEIESYARSMLYGFIGVEFSPNRFDQCAELHYAKFKDYWVGVANYVKKSLDGLI